MNPVIYFRNLLTGFESRIRSEMRHYCIDPGRDDPLYSALLYMNPQADEPESHMRIFLRSFTPFFRENKNRLEELLPFVQLSYLVWGYLVQAKSGASAERGEYLTFAWKEDPPEIQQQIRERIRPATTLASIDIDFSDMVLLEKHLRQRCCRTFLDDRLMEACKKGTVAGLIKRLYSARE